MLKVADRRVVAPQWKDHHHLAPPVYELLACMLLHTSSCD